MKNKGWTWWCHHGQLLEYCTDYAGRVRYIKEKKPANEISLRLQAFQLVKGKLPVNLLEARAAYNRAREARDKLYAACDRAWATYDKAFKASLMGENICYKKEQAYNKTRVAYWKAENICYKKEQACDKVRATCLPQLAKLFCKEHPELAWRVAWKKDIQHLIF